MRRIIQTVGCLALVVLGWVGRPVAVRAQGDTTTANLCNGWQCQGTEPWKVRELTMIYQSTPFACGGASQPPCCKLRVTYRFRQSCNSQYLEVLDYTVLNRYCNIQQVDPRRDVHAIIKELMTTNPMGFRPTIFDSAGCDSTVKVGVASCFSFDYLPGDSVRYWPCDGLGCCTINYVACWDGQSNRRYIAQNFTSSNITCIQNGHNCVSSCPFEAPVPPRENDPELSWNFEVHDTPRGRMPRSSGGVGQ